MTLWEIAAAVDGYNFVHGAEPEPEPMTVERFDELVAVHSPIISRAVH